MIRWVTTPESFVNSVVYIGYHTEDGRRLYTASGFLVRVNDQPGADLRRDWPLYVLTARHVIAKIRHAGYRLSIAIQCAGNALFEIADPENWVEHEQQDLALAELDVTAWCKPPRLEEYAWGQIVTSISIWQFFSAPVPRRQAMFSDPVHMVGLWQASYEATWPPIVRTGFFAATSPRELQLETGRATVHMVDGTVTRGMSGGLAFMSAGPMDVDNRVLGLIHGYWPLPETELEGVDVKNPVDERGNIRTDAERAQLDALRVLERRVEAINSKLALIVRDIEIENFLAAVRGNRCWPPPHLR